MRTVYVLVYMQKTAGPDGKEFMTPTPYAVFEDSITAEKMKRDGDEIIRVPYFEDKSDRSNLLSTSPNSIHVMPCNDRTTVTYQSTPWSKNSTMAPPDYEPFPRVSCSKTIDEHTWRDRSD